MKQYERYVIEAAKSWYEASKGTILGERKVDGQLRSAIDALIASEQQPSPVEEEERKHYSIDAGDFNPDKHEWFHGTWGSASKRLVHGGETVRLFLRKPDSDFLEDYQDFELTGPIVVRDKPSKPSLWTALEQALTNAELVTDHGLMDGCVSQNVGIALVLDTVRDHLKKYGTDELVEKDGDL